MGIPGISFWLYHNGDPPCKIRTILYQDSSIWVNSMPHIFVRSRMGHYQGKIVQVSLAED